MALFAAALLCGTSTAAHAQSFTAQAWPDTLCRHAALDRATEVTVRGLGGAMAQTIFEQVYEDCLNWKSEHGTVTPFVAPSLSCRPSHDRRSVYALKRATEVCELGR